MSVLDIYRRHVVVHNGERKGRATSVILRPYEKNSAFRVARSGEGNTTDAEIPCEDLNEVARYVESGGYLVRMKSESPRVEGLYTVDEIEVIR